MRPGYKYPDTEHKISDIFAPAYLLLALGMDYKPTPYFSAFIAPLTAKFTFVNDNVLSAAGAFGVTPGEKTRSEIGGYVRAIYTRNDFKNEFLKNVGFTTKIDLFSNYAENPQNIDISWETLIALKVNKFISVNFNTHLLYDDNIKVPVDRNNNGIIESFRGSRVQEHSSRKSLELDFHINSDINQLNPDKMKILDEFKKFAMKGNVIDMAVGIIIGAAFGKIVSSVVNDILMPPIGLLLGGVNFTDLKVVMKAATETVPAVTWNYGNFIQVSLIS